MIPYDTGATSGVWPLILQPYGNIDKVRQCPEANVPNPTNSQGSAVKPWNNPAANPVANTGAYTLNGWLYKGPAVTTGTNFLLRYSITLNVPTSTNPTSDFFWNYPFTTSTSVIPVVADGTWTEAWPLSDNPPPTLAQEQTGGGSSNANQMYRVAIARHGKSVNVAFADAHADTVPLQKLWTLQWYKGFQSPNPLPNVP